MRTQLAVKRVVIVACLLFLGSEGGHAQNRETQPPSPPVPMQVCPECLIHLRATMALRDELVAIHKRQAELRKKSADNDAAQKKGEARIKSLESELGSQEGTGGSGHDPATGLTTESTTHADGTVHIRVTDGNGNVLEERVRERGDLSRVRHDIDAANAELAALKKAATDLEAERKRLDAKEKVTTDRLNDAIRQLAECLETRCKHLIGLRLDDIAAAFGLPVPGTDPKSDPKTPKAGPLSTAKSVRMITVIPGVNGGRVSLVFQIIILDGAVELAADVEPSLSPWAGVRRFALNWFAGPTAAFPSVRATGSALPRMARTGDIVTRQSNGSAAGAGQLTAALIATGNSTGQVFRMQALNSTGQAASIGTPDGLVVQPLQEAARTAVQKPASQLQSQAVNGFCLDYGKLPPTAGTLYRVADEALQQQFAPMKQILQAGRQLVSEGRLHPDSDPAAYGDAVRQWALWSKLERWDAKAFEQHFIERTRKNAEAARQTWTKALEQRVRELVPNRWRDITAIWTEAEASARPLR